MYTENEDDPQPDRRQMHHPQNPFFLMKSRLEARLVMQFWKDAEDEKPMFTKQLVLAFGDFSRLQSGAVVRPRKEKVSAVRRAEVSK
jgi:hypothetical protein